MSISMHSQSHALWAVNKKGLPTESSSGLEATHPILSIALTILVLIRMLSVCNAENTRALATYDPNNVAMGRQDCNGNTCCLPPYEIVSSRLWWPHEKSGYSCCVPKTQQRDRETCCPHPLIPSKEPNVDPSLGPFCCDPVTGHCCKKLYISIKKGEKPEWIYSEPKNGNCCPTHDENFKKANTRCCPRPLQLALASTHSLFDIKRDVNSMCCSNPELCRALSWHYDDFPTKRFCSPRKFCCPWPYAPVMRIVRDPKTDKVIFENGAPKYYAKYDNQCESPTGKICTLPQVPSYNSCIEQQFATEVSLQDTPLYDMTPYEFSNADPSTTAASSTVQCLKSDVFRRAYGSPLGNPGAHSVPIDWFVTRPYVQRSKLLNETTYVLEQLWKWPDVIMPFIFPITMAAISVATMLPVLLLGAICWALLFNFRFMWHKKVRMALRWIFVIIEKRRRKIQDNFLPPEDRRKFHKRDRYQLPKSIQDSDRSDDDEPEDLKRTNIDLKESHWTQEEIDALGFDPDNIPVDWIYGDLLGNPSALRKEVKAYNTKASRRPILVEDDEIMKQLDLEEWLHFLSKGETDNDAVLAQGAKLSRKRSIHRFKIRKKVAKRTKVRITIKPSMTSHAKPSTSKVALAKKSLKSKSKKKKPHRKGTSV